MGRIVVDVMLKPEILDPQGQAVHGALARLGLGHFTAVRQGKRFVLTVDGEVTAAALSAARPAADKLLRNPVIAAVLALQRGGSPASGWAPAPSPPSSSSPWRAFRKDIWHI